MSGQRNIYWAAEGETSDSGWWTKRKEQPPSSAILVSLKDLSWAACYFLRRPLERWYILFLFWPFQCRPRRKYGGHVLTFRNYSAHQALMITGEHLCGRQTLPSPLLFLIPYGQRLMKKVFGRCSPLIMCAARERWNGFLVSCSTSHTVIQAAIFLVCRYDDERRKFLFLVVVHHRRPEKNTRPHV